MHINRRSGNEVLELAISLPRPPFMGAGITAPSIAAKGYNRPAGPRPGPADTGLAKTAWLLVLLPQAGIL
jgi:hypothetical protein